MVDRTSADDEGRTGASADGAPYASAAAAELARGVGLDPARGAPEPLDVTPEDLQRIGEDPGAVDEVVARLRKKPTVLEAAFRNENIYVYAVAVVLIGVVAAWIFH